MLSDLLKEIKQYNLCTWYLLPATGLTRSSFGELFVSSYLETSRLWIIVQVPDINLVRRELRDRAVKQWNTEHGGFLAYQLNYSWEGDMHKYIKGKYSRFSNNLKGIIFERSGLQYQEVNGEGKFITDARLMAVESKTELREYLKEELGVTELPEELLSIPPPESFMDVTEV